MLLERRDFLICFVSACIAFVPVVYIGGLIVCIEPVSALMLHIGFSRISIWIAIHILIYTAAFLGIGTASYALIRRLPWNLAREFALVGLLALPVLSSFARVLTYSSIQGRGGTYNFWEATERYFERRSK
jgi:hypothetical protein